MHTLVIYDITDDQTRMKIAEACKSAGLVRIQKSAFLGTINSQVRKGLIMKLRKILGDQEGNIQIFLICEADIRLREMIGKPTEEEEDMLIL